MLVLGCVYLSLWYVLKYFFVGKEIASSSKRKGPRSPSLGEIVKRMRMEMKRTSDYGIKIQNWEEKVELWAAIA